MNSCVELARVGSAWSGRRTTKSARDMLRLRCCMHNIPMTKADENDFSVVLKGWRNWNTRVLLRSLSGGPTTGDSTFSQWNIFLEVTSTKRPLRANSLRREFWRSREGLERHFHMRIHRVWYIEMLNQLMCL